MDRSFFLVILIIPVKKAAMPKIPAKSIGIERVRLSKNVLPPRSPEATRREKIANSKRKAVINPKDHFPKIVFGIL